jgi:hypothetical protein
MKTIKTVAFYCKDKFVQLVDAYLKMKDGFVADNEKEVDKQATMMLAIINSTPDSLLAGETLNYWKEKKGFLLAHLKLYKEAEKDKDKRLNFVFLSTVVVKSVKPLGYISRYLLITVLWQIRTKARTMPLLSFIKTLFGYSILRRREFYCW